MNGHRAGPVLLGDQVPGILLKAVSGNTATSRVKKKSYYIIKKIMNWFDAMIS